MSDTDKKYNLTKWMTRHANKLTMAAVRTIMNTPGISPDIGNLPETLRQHVPGYDLNTATKTAFMTLANFIAHNRSIISDYRTTATIPFPDWAALFNTPCTVTIRNRRVGDELPWVGATSNVIKISFPELNAHYAVKVFRHDKYISPQGPWHDIPVAFAAAHAEPRDNVPTYMASFGPIKYLMTQWMGDDEDAAPGIRNNKHELFYTNPAEIRPDNWRRGRRIDFGHTMPGQYGAASYRVRKMYRCLIDAGSKYGEYGIRGIIAHCTTRQDNENLAAAMRLAQCNAPLAIRQILTNMR